MRLWLLRPRDDTVGAWLPWYDKAFGFVVRAETGAAARLFAEDESGDESSGVRHPWLDSQQTSCVELIAEGKSGVIIRDFARA